MGLAAAEQTWAAFLLEAGGWRFNSLSEIPSRFGQASSWLLARGVHIRPCVPPKECGVNAKLALESSANLSRQFPRRLSIARIALETEPSLVTLMEAADLGSKSAADDLFSALYGQLRRIAKIELARHGGPMSLGATTLLHRAYIEIADREGASFPDRNRFIGYAAHVMRGLIIDHARSRCAQKRGGQFEITALGTEVEDAPNAEGSYRSATRSKNWPKPSLVLQKSST